MKELFSKDFNANSFEMPELEVNTDTNVLRVVVHNLVGIMDADLHVTYDRSEWHYGGGCRGASRKESEDHVHFDFQYRMSPKRLRGRFNFDKTDNYRISILSME